MLSFFIKYWILKIEGFQSRGNLLPVKVALQGVQQMGLLKTCRPSFMIIIINGVENKYHKD